MLQMFARRTLGGISGARHLSKWCRDGRAENLGRAGLAATTVHMRHPGILRLSGVLPPLHQELRCHRHTTNSAAQERRVQVERGGSVHGTSMRTHHSADPVAPRLPPRLCCGMRHIHHGLRHRAPSRRRTSDLLQPPTSVAAYQARCLQMGTHWAGPDSPKLAAVPMGMTVHHQDRSLQFEVPPRPAPHDNPSAPVGQQAHQL
jgi:hypothetical protein